MKKNLLKALEKVLNAYIALDPEAKNSLQILEGKKITLHLLNNTVSLQLFFVENKIVLLTEDLAPADTIISGGPFGLLHIALSKNQRKNLFADNVKIEGDMDVGMAMMNLFDRIEIDWEDYLSQWIGDTPAYRSGQVVSKIKKMATALQQNFLRHIDEYIHEEINLFPTKEALQDFFLDVDCLRMDVDRLEARVLHLQKIKETSA